MRLRTCTGHLWLLASDTMAIRFLLCSLFFAHSLTSFIISLSLTSPSAHPPIFNVLILLILHTKTFTSPRSPHQSSLCCRPGVPF